jgi:hypothetical protein
MPVDPNTSLAIMQKELEACQVDASLHHWEISQIDEPNQVFTVKMKSPIDNEEYILEIKFDNYKEIPLYIEFIDPTTGERGTKNAYPASKGKTGSFFHTNQCICHPCSRKAYSGLSGLHPEWTMAGWQSNEKTGTLTNIRAILSAIYYRISNEEEYGGRMHA